MDKIIGLFIILSSTLFTFFAIYNNIKHNIFY